MPQQTRPGHRRWSHGARANVERAGLSVMPVISTSAGIFGLCAYVSFSHHGGENQAG